MHHAIRLSADVPRASPASSCAHATLGGPSRLALGALDECPERVEVVGPEDRQARSLRILKVLDLEDASKHGGRHCGTDPELLEPPHSLLCRVVVETLDRVGARVRHLALDGKDAPVE